MKVCGWGGVGGWCGWVCRWMVGWGVGGGGEGEGQLPRGASPPPYCSACVHGPCARAARFTHTGAAARCTGAWRMCTQRSPARALCKDCRVRTRAAAARHCSWHLLRRRPPAHRVDDAGDAQGPHLGEGPPGLRQGRARRADRCGAPLHRHAALLLPGAPPSRCPRRRRPGVRGARRFRGLPSCPRCWVRHGHVLAATAAASARTHCVAPRARPHACCTCCARCTQGTQSAPAPPPPLQTPKKLYLVLDFINGGHLFFQVGLSASPLHGPGTACMQPAGASFLAAPATGRHNRWWRR